MENKEADTKIDDKDQENYCPRCKLQLDQNCGESIDQNGALHIKADAKDQLQKSKTETGLEYDSLKSTYDKSKEFDEILNGLELSCKNESKYDQEYLHLQQKALRDLKYKMVCNYKDAILAFFGEDENSLGKLSEKITSLVDNSKKIQEQLLQFQQVLSVNHQELCQFSNNLKSYMDKKKEFIEIFIDDILNII